MSREQFLSFCLLLRNVRARTSLAEMNGVAYPLRLAALQINSQETKTIRRVISYHFLRNVFSYRSTKVALRSNRFIRVINIILCCVYFRLKIGKFVSNLSLLGF